jgi:hypothetical protein
VNLLSLGGPSIGVLALGGGAIGGLAPGGGALGGGAVGYYACGAGASGAHVVSVTLRDPEAEAFFRGHGLDPVCLPPPRRR